MAANVVRLRQSNSAVAENEDEFLEDLRGMLWADGRAQNWQSFAEDATLCYSTVRNFASGDTKRPHWRTIEKLTIALGFRFAIVPAGAPCQPDEVVPSRRKR